MSVAFRKTWNGLTVMKQNYTTLSFLNSANFKNTESKVTAYYRYLIKISGGVLCLNIEANTCIRK
jgi:hypothetical protein